MYKMWATVVRGVGYGCHLEQRKHLSKIKVEAPLVPRGLSNRIINKGNRIPP